MGMKEQMDEHAKGRYIKGTISEDGNLKTEIHKISMVEMVAFAMTKRVLLIEKVVREL